MGATIVMTARDRGKGEVVKKEVQEAGRGGKVDLLQCDLASLDSVRSCCTRFTKRHEELHVLINNAGMWNPKRKLSKDRIEETFAVNYLAPFLMTNLLLDTIGKGRPSRIVNVTSGLHMGVVDFDNIEFERKYKGVKSYRQSKLALILFTRLLAKKLEGKGVTVNCFNPGMTKTDLGRDSGFLMRGIFKLMGKPVEEGADGLIFLASSPEAEGVSGEYFEKRDVGKSSEESRDMEMARRLWKVSERYVGL
jgi:NAD(P)-dependent dehydrogenase (short-subunit alcohol dehydrogenase family)